MQDNKDQETNPTPDTTTSGVDTTTGTTPVVVAETTSTPEVVPAATVEVAATPVEQTTVTPEATPVVAAAAPMVAAPTSVLKHYLIAFGIVLVMGVALWYILEKQDRVDTNIFGNIEAMINPEPAAAIVNGERLTVAQVERNKEQLRANATAGGLDPAAPEVAAEVDRQALELLINTALLRQAAAAAGITVTADAVEARYQDILTQIGGEEELASRMADLGITIESLRTDIEGELVIQSYLDQAVDVSTVTVSDAEVESFYAQLGGGPAVDVPPLAEVYEAIKSQLTSQKVDALITEHIAELKAKAEISYPENN